jgi:hypothetical protein
MKVILTVCMILVSSISVKADNIGTVTLRTEVSTLFHVGLEVPVYRKFTLDGALRHYTTYYFEDIERTDLRASLRYYFKTFEKGNTNFDENLYWHAGIHYRVQSLSNYPNQDDSREEGSLDITNGVVGIGMKDRFFNIWLGFEFPIFEFVNRYTYRSEYGGITTDRKWKATPWVSIGVGINLVSIHFVRE